MPPVLPLAVGFLCTVACGDSIDSSPGRGCTGPPEGSFPFRCLVNVTTVMSAVLEYRSFGAPTNLDQGGVERAVTATGQATS
jgi:hypothetical protein